MRNGRFVVPPTLSGLLDSRDQGLYSDFRVAMPGTIVSYDAGKGTAVITPGYARVYSDDSTTDTKNIVDCPVFVLQGGGIHIGLPIKKDDECLVIFGDADIDAWFENGG